MLIEEEIIICPSCEQGYSINSYVSWSNNQNTPFYSDGHIGGNYPYFISIVKCLNISCREFFNIEKEKRIPAHYTKTTKDKKDSKTCINLNQVENIGIQELEEALETNFCKEDKENEKKTRLLLLRRYNDPIRRNSEYLLLQERRNKMLENIERLIELYIDTVAIENRILLAEFYREKGDFKTCMELLRNVMPESETERIILGCIYNYAEQEEKKVFEV